VSPTGGLSFLPTAPHGVGCAFQGQPIVDAAGTLYEPSVACGAHLWKTTNAGVTWTSLPVPVLASSDAPGIAATPEGTLYFFYTGTDWKPAFVRSGNGGATWSGPFSVGVPGLTSSALPAIVAGTDGRIALEYYGTTSNPVGWDHNPGNAPSTVRWNGYVAVITNAASATPTIEVAQVNPGTDPLQIGCMTKLGGCLSNIADYMGIDAGPDGHVWPVFVDGCPPGCTTAAASNQGRAFVGVQTGGPTL
jgi:hypothetical protein